jgi:hypothetical protein
VANARSVVPQELFRKETEIRIKRERSSLWGIAFEQSMNDFATFLKKSLCTSKSKKWSTLLNELVSVVFGVKVAVLVESYVLDREQLTRICREAEKVRNPWNACAQCVNPFFKKKKIKKNFFSCLVSSKMHSWSLKSMNAFR